MATYTVLKKNGFLLTPAPVSVYTVPGATKARVSFADVENMSLVPGRVWAWIAPSGWTPNVSSLGVDLRNDAAAVRRNGLGPGAVGGSGATLPGAAATIASGLMLTPGTGVNLAVTPFQMLTGEQLWMMGDYADYGTENAAVITTAEVVSAAGTSTYPSATTCLDTAMNLTASAANGDCVGRRLETSTAYAIVTSNAGGATTSTLTFTDGWRFKANGRAYVNPADGTLVPTTLTAFTICASVRDTRKTTLGQDVYVGHLFTTGAFNARRQAVCVGNSAGITTFGSVFQIVNDYNGTAGGWPTGTPTTGKDWLIDSLVRGSLMYIEES